MTLLLSLSSSYSTGNPLKVTNCIRSSIRSKVSYGPYDGPYGHPSKRMRHLRVPGGCAPFPAHMLPKWESVSVHSSEIFGTVLAHLARREMATSGAICTEADLVLPPLPAVFLKRKLSGKSKDATALVVTQWSKQGFEFVSSARRNSFAQICESDLYPVECATSNDDIWNALEHILVQ